MTREPYVTLELKDTDHRPVLLHVYADHWHALYNPGDDPTVEEPYNKRRWWNFPAELTNEEYIRGIYAEWQPWVEAAREELKEKTRENVHHP